MLGLLCVRTKLNTFQEARPRRKQALPGTAKRHQTPLPCSLLILNLGHLGMETCYLQDSSQDCHLHGVLNSQMGVMEFEFF